MESEDTVRDAYEERSRSENLGRALEVVETLRLEVVDTLLFLVDAEGRWVVPEASWQRCRVHFMRNLLSTVPRSAQEAVAAIVRTIFAEPDHGSAMGHLKEVSTMLRARFPQAAELLEDAAEDVLAHMHFPRAHRKRLHSTNPPERLHKEVKRRTDVVGVFPNRDSLLRIVATLLQEQGDEWQVAERRYFSIESMKHIDELEGGEPTRELLAAIG